VDRAGWRATIPLEDPVNRRALLVLLSVTAAALAVTLWLVAELGTAAGSSGPAPAERAAPTSR